MKAPVSWIAELVELPAGLDGPALGEALVRVGLEVERVSAPADAVSGPLLLGRVRSVEELTEFKKPIRYCLVEVGEAEPRGIVCGARNFAEGDLVVVALPGAVLPGPFPITARQTYGRTSDGMICSARELGLGDEHSGILVLPADAGRPGESALDVLGMRDAVLDIAVTPDRGYCLAIRGLAREAAAALDVPFTDLPAPAVEPGPDGYPVTVSDPAGCDRFEVRAVTGLDARRPTPEFIAARLRACGMRSISLAVDITNYVMLETGQPLHGYDRAQLSGPLGVRRAEPGEKLTTLDDAVRSLDPDDLVITDDRGPIGLAGVMGGATTELSEATTEVLLEAAHFDPATVGRMVRRHKLPSEAAKRFERGVDPAMAPVALRRCVELLVAHGGASPVAGGTVVGDGPAPVRIELPVTRPGELAGTPISAGAVRRRLEQVGCRVEVVAGPAEAAGTARHAEPGADEVLAVVPPSWRPDLTDPADLIEEVVRLEGYDKVPSVLPRSPLGRGWSAEQRLRRSVSRALAEAGYTEVISYPFVAPVVHDAFGLAPDDVRRRALRLANPISDAEPELRTSLLPGLLANLSRNLGRGNRELALFEMGLVYLPAESAEPAPRPGVEHRPSDAELAAIERTVPVQPRHLATVLAGDRELPGWWGPGRPANWADAIDSARVAARAARVGLEIRQADVAPWHPGRCAQLLLDGAVIGTAGELMPRVVAALDLPPRTCAMELNLDAFVPPPPAEAPVLSNYPPVLLDLALVVAAGVPAAEVLAAVRDGAGELLESVRLFDVYTDDQRLGPELKSLAFALRFRAPDRTLTVEEATAARDAAVAEAGSRLGAVLRG
ncbi:phenylalanine--tRNA ligase subunit beta [Jatrophihabitans sp.]|uniref:phenylalanine--tRNA ligase subunit beta n=1 Tax=Jatrophihabitans sp. TaxID=1932789 RepID=UPI002C8D920F|nr:phenylalanine--tRNA ligase subunit beta [Jatrophihabitans sp.]